MLELLLTIAVGSLAGRHVPSMIHGLKERTIILTYHDVVPKRTRSSLWFDVTPHEFNDQLDWYVIRGCTFISIEQLYKHLTTGAMLPPRPVMVTFADNYEGFYKYALPDVTRRRLPITMFVHTAFVGKRRGRPKMSWDQLKELDKAGLVTIASQTDTHPPDLRKLTNEQLRIEMFLSKQTLEEQLGHKVDYLAYPNGKFDSRVAHFARAAGYTMAFTEEQRPAELSPDIFEVARYVHTKYINAFIDSYGAKAVGRLPQKEHKGLYDTRSDQAGFGMKKL